VTVSANVNPKPRQALAAVAASFWIAAPACLGMIGGGVAPWATVWGLMSLSGTRFHGWFVVALGIVGLAMLSLYVLRGARLPLLVAAACGALGALQAMATLAKIDADGSVTVFGLEYHYADPAWGLYLALAASATLACSATVTWFATRGRS
jgi:hypothetical protein